MSGTKPTPETRRLRYMFRALQMNPLERSDEIVQLRDRCLGIAPPVSATSAAAGEDLHEKRAKAKKVIEQVRRKFWSMDLRQLQRRLASLQLDEFPDLKHAAHRLKVTADHRHLLPELSQHRHFDPELFSALKTVFVCAPRKAADIKEESLRLLRIGDERRRTQKMAKLLDREFPELYDLEEDWLDSIVHYRPRKMARAATSSGSGASSGGGGFSFDGYGYGWLIWIVILTALRLMRMALRDQ